MHDAKGQKLYIYIKKVKIKISIMNPFFPDIFWMFLSQGNLKTISFILNWNKTIFCNVGQFGKSILTYPTPGRELRADCEL